jgi:ketosteroid isomerase-like protein
MSSPVETITEEQKLAEIEAFHQTDMKAAAAKDIETLLGLWTEDCVLLAPGMPPIIGKEAMWRYLQEQNDAASDVEILEYEQDFKEVKLVGDWAFEWGLFHGRSCPLGGEIVQTKAKLFRVLKRTEESGWKCARSIFHVDEMSEDE